MVTPLHIRTSNPIELTFATVRLRSDRSRDCGSRETTLALVFKLLRTGEQHWRRITAFAKLELVVNNVQLREGEHVTGRTERVAA